MEALQVSKKDDFLSLIQLLDLLGYESQWMPVDQENPVEHLVILLETEASEKRLPVRLIWLEDIVDTGMDALGGGVGLHDSFTLEFYAPLMLTIPPEKTPDITLLAQAFSRTLFFGAVGFMPKRGFVYRYCLPHVNRELNVELVAQMLTIITASLNLFLIQVAEFLNGRPLSELLAKGKN